MKRSKLPKMARCSITGRAREDSERDIFGVQPLRQHEIHLQRAALPVPADGVAQHEFQFGAVEGALAGVQRVGDAGDFAGVLQGLFGAVPVLRRQEPARTSGRSENLTAKLS